MRKRSGFVAKMRICRLEVNGHWVVDASIYPQTPQSLLNSISVCDSNDEEMPIGLAMGGEPGEAEICRATKFTEISICSAAARRVPAIEVFELDGKNGALKSFHPVVEPDLDMMVEPKLSMVAQLAQALGDRRVVGDNCASLAERS